MATPNYSYEKRQRELAKKKKNEEKRLRKLSGKPDDTHGDNEGEAETSGEAADTTQAPAPADKA